MYMKKRDMLSLGVFDKHCEWRLVASFDWLQKLGFKSDLGKWIDQFMVEERLLNCALALSYYLFRGNLYITLCKSTV